MDKLEGRTAPPHSRTYPKRFGKYIMRYVYDTLDKDISNWLRENNPNPAWDHHHHQWLTEEFGHPKLIRHLMSVLGIMKASSTMEAFKENMLRAYPDSRINRLKRQRKENIRKQKEQGIEEQIELTYI